MKIDKSIGRDRSVFNNPEIEAAVNSRPLPFKASFHGDSTIILDGAGNWATGQVPRDIANQLALSMTEAAKARRNI